MLEAHGGPYSYLATDIQKSVEHFKLQNFKQQEQKSNLSHPFPVQQDEDTGEIPTRTLYVSIFRAIFK